MQKIASRSAAASSSCPFMSPTRPSSTAWRSPPGAQPAAPAKPSNSGYRSFCSCRKTRVSRRCTRRKAVRSASMVSGTPSRRIICDVRSYRVMPKPSLVSSATAAITLRLSDVEVQLVDRHIQGHRLAVADDVDRHAGARPGADHAALQVQRVLHRLARVGGDDVDRPRCPLRRQVRPARRSRRSPREARRGQAPGSRHSAPRRSARR